MINLLASLRDTEAPILTVIAKFWGVDAARLQPDELPAALEAVMRDADSAARAWDKLDDAQRGVLQTLIGAKGQMPAAMFERLNGEIRKLGRGAIDRENPLEHAKSHAEALFYRGFIYKSYQKAATGAQGVIYIPADFLAVLPTHKTGYDNLEALAQDVNAALSGGQGISREDARVDPIDADFLDAVQPADTTIVDDMTTLLAYLQVFGADIEGDALSDEDVRRITPHLMHPDAARLAFLFEVGISAELIDAHEAQARPHRAPVKRWLEAKRAAQLKTLAEAWYTSTVYRELWHIPGLYPEPTGWPYEAKVAREALAAFLRDFTPPGEWWSIDEFIMLVKAVEPDFQRPGGDYNSWYIRNADGEYLHGFESWDAVEGALLEFYLFGPMHWLGMVDLSEDAARLNAYGRAFALAEAWPAPQEQEDKISVQADGVLTASRRVPRMDRFQAMRFTTWISAATDATPYTYKISMEGVRQAAQQGVNTGHISAFLTRMMGTDALSPTLTKLLETWGEGVSQSVTLEELLVLRTTAPETLDYILEQPALRRYCGARLGPMAVAVRRDQWEEFREALEAKGIEVHL